MSMRFVFRLFVGALPFIVMPLNLSAKIITKTTTKITSKSTVKSPEKKIIEKNQTELKGRTKKAESKNVSKRNLEKDRKSTKKQPMDKKVARSSGKKEGVDHDRKRNAPSPKKVESIKATSGMKVTTLRVAGKSIKVEVASTEAEQEKGLMYRKSLPADSGMLFDFKSPAKTCMWMKNTYIPLSVAFIDVKGKVVNIEEMKARTTTTHCSQDWIRYALEMNAKWFSKHGVKPGSRVTGLPR